MTTRMSYDQLEKLLAECPMPGGALSVNDSHALIILIVQELRELRDEVREMRLRGYRA